jgi:hypothetical protein
VISVRFPLASVFLLVAGIVFAIAYALPLLFFPLEWARVFRWRLPEDTALTVYFGRCLGAVAVGIVTVCLMAVPEPESHGCCSVSSRSSER